MSKPTTLDPAPTADGDRFGSSGAPLAIDTIELDISGMTCASCAARIEKKLNRLDDVSASVNYATESAVVSVPEGFDTNRLVATVEGVGYHVEALRSSADDQQSNRSEARRVGQEYRSRWTPYH